MILLYVGLVDGKVRYATTDDETAGIAKSHIIEGFGHVIGAKIEYKLDFKTFEITPELLSKIDSLNVTHD